MAVTSSALTSLYEDIVADLIPYYDNAVLLPNPSLIVNSYNLEGAVGNTVKIPVTDAWGSGNSTISENTPIIINAGEDFGPSNVSLSVNKRAAGSRVSTESLEDGGLGVVSQATTTRLARAIAQGTDIAGFNFMFSGAEAALTDVANITTISNDGTEAPTNVDAGIVFSPEAMGYAVKRSPEVKMFEDIDTDSVEFVSTVRNGFARIKTDYMRAVTSSSVIAEGTDANRANLNMFAESVANLRAVNAPTDAGGFYIACVTPA